MQFVLAFSEALCIPALPGCFDAAQSIPKYAGLE
jgi:hypothetical protein